MSSDGIATALQDSASALMEGGNNLEQAVALVAAANRVVQDPNSVGSALRTISLRLRGTSVEVLEEIGEETDGVIESTSKLQSKIKALSGVNILTDAGEYKDTYTILKEIGTVWKEMSDIDQAALLELMAGKNRANTLSAILSNMTDLEGAYNDALKAEGSALKENQTYLDSIQGRIDLFNNSLQTMWMNLLDTSFIKGFVDAGTGLIKFLDSSEGRFTALSAAVAVLGKVLKIGPAFKITNDQLQILGKTTDTIRNNFAQLSAESTNWFGKTIGAGFKSIFGSDVGTIDLTDMLSEDDFNNKINGIITGFNGIDQSIQKIKWNDFVDGQTGIDDATKATLKTFELQNGQIVANSNAYKTYTGACATAAVGNNAVDGSVKKTTASLIGQKVAALAANAALTMGISLLISLGVKLVSTWVNAEKTAAEAARSAVDASQKIREQTDTLEDYKEQINDLRKELDNNTLSEQEAYDAREKLLTIQGELIDKYGLEKDGINLVTGAINEQIAAIDELQQKKSQQWINNNQKSINDAIAYFDNNTQGSDLDGFWETGQSAITNWGSSLNVTKMISEYANHSQHITTRDNKVLGQDIYFSGSVEEVKAEVEDFQNWLSSKETELQSDLYNLTSISAEQQTDAIKTKIETLKTDIEQLQDVREDIGTEYANWFGENSIYAANKKVLEETQYNTALTQYATQYGNILQAQKDLAEAQAKGDQEGIAAAIETINAETEAAASTARTNGQNYMVEFFQGIKDGYATQTKDIEISLNLSTVEGKNALRDALAGFDGKNAKEILQAYEIEPDGDAFVKLKSMADSYEISVQELINSLVKLGHIQGDFNNNNMPEVTSVVSSIDTLTSAVEKYKTALETVNSITFDGQAISKDYYDALKEQLADVTVGTEEFSDAIKEQNGKYIVKNVALLKKLVAQSKKAKKATIEVARSQAQLQYRDVVDQMRNAILIMGVEYDAYNLITDATFDNISAMREQIDTLKQTIQQYALLEIGLSDAASAYDEYEAAKERDAQLSYDESFSEMLKTIDEGLLKNETGSEAFEYSVRAVVPEVIWSGIEDPNEKVKAIHDYIDGDKTFSKLFHVDEESGELDVNTDNVREFIKLSKEAGMIVGGPEGFELDNTVYGTKEWAEALNITEASVLALLSATEDCDALWGNILTDVMTHPLDREINKSVDEVDEATKALEDYLKSVQSGDEEFKSDHYNELVSAIGAATDKLDENRQAALDNAQSYNTVQAAISSFRGDLTLTDGEATNLVSSLKEIDDLGDLGEIEIQDGQLKLTDEQLTLILGKLGKITEPSVIQVQLRYDEISAEIDQINEYIKNKSTGSITIDGITFTNGADADGNVIEDYLAKLTAEQKEIQLTYSITETSTEEEKSVLESYQEMAKNGVQFTVTAIVDDAKEGLDSVSDAQKNIKEKQTITFSTNASTVEQAIKDFADEYDRISSKVITLTVNVEKKEVVSSVDPNPAKGLPLPGKGIGGQTKRVSRALGNARANGTPGLNKAEHDTIVGEIGPELVVDPINGIYYTVGENGTEMVNLPKGAIIYNHKQTEELLRNGHTTRGRYTGGLSFARGNAYADYGIPNYHPNFNDETSFKNGTDINTTWDDAVSTLNSAANKISDAMSDAADSVGEFEETIDWIEIRMKEYDEHIGMLTAKLENLTTVAEKNAKIDEIIAENKKKQADAEAGAKYYEEYAQKYLAGMNSTLVEAAKNGAIAITEFTKEQDEATVNAIQNYRDYAQKAADLYQQAEEILTDIRNSVIQKIDNIQGYGSAKTNIEDLQTEKLQSMVDLDETSGLITSSEYYKAMMENSGKKIEYWEPLLADMQKEFDNAVQSGSIKIGSVEWYEQIAKLYEVQAEIDAATIELEEFQNAINDIYWDNFDQLINRLDYLKDETQSLIDLMDSEDMVITPETDDGWNSDQVEWTKEGLASLGLYAQQMEIAEYTAKQYAEAIDDLTKDYKDGLYSENEYIEKLEELKSAQYDSIEAYYDALDAIKDLQKARVDEIKNGIEKQVDAYEKLIKKKKEALDSEKDLYDFQKNTAEQQKNIAQIERQLAALANDHSLSATAKRKQLEAELAEAQYELQDTYYNRSVEDKQTVLDKELEDFQNEKDAEIQKWDEYLTNVEALVAESLGIVQANASEIGQTLTDKASEYNITVSNAITEPWKDGSLAVSDYQTTFDTAMSSTMDQLDALKNKWQEVIDRMTEAGKVNVSAINKENTNYAAATKTEPPKPQEQEDPSKDTNQNSGASNTRSDQEYYGVALAIWQGNYGWGSGNARVKNLTSKGFDANKVQEIVNKIGNDGYIHNGSWKGKYYGIKDLTPYHLNKFAKGTNSANKDQWAIIDELGDELQLVPGINGRLEYIKKGTGIVPADLTKRLVDMAMDPQDMLDRNRPAISAPHIINNEINIDCSVDTMVRIEHCDQNTLPDVEKLVNKAFDKHMQTLNNSIRRFTR